MSAFTIPESVLGIPLYVPSQYNYFAVDPAAMPNGDPCLIVNGAVSDQYKAFIPAPTWSQDILNAGDNVAGRHWSMSCWLKLSNLTSLVANSVMLGCSAYESVTPFNSTSNVGFPFVLGTHSVSAGVIDFKRECLNNVASPPSSKIIELAPDFSQFQDYWFLLVVTVDQQGIAGAWNTVGNMYVDSHPEAFVADTAGGSSPSGAFLPRKYLHIGAYHSGGVGRNDQWRIGKWAFHDHVLSAAERMSMWQAMYGAPPRVYTDSFNRASLGNNWKLITGTAFDISGNEARGSGQTIRLMMYVRDLGQPNMYSQVVLRSVSDLQIAPLVRCGAYGTAAGYSGAYETGAGATPWRISRNQVVIGNSAGAAPSAGDLIRMEAITNGSNNVDLNLYRNGTLMHTMTDSSGSKLLTGSNAGLYLRGQIATPVLADDFECGTL